MPCNLWPVVAKLEFTEIWVALIFPIFVLCVAVSGKFTEVVKVLGFSLNRGAAFRGGSGQCQCSHCTHLTSSIETVHTLWPSQFFHLLLAFFFNFTLIYLHKVTDKRFAIPFEFCHIGNRIHVPMWSSVLEPALQFCLNAIITLWVLLRNSSANIELLVAYELR